MEVHRDLGLRGCDGGKSNGPGAEVGNEVLLVSQQGLLRDAGTATPGDPGGERVSSQYNIWTRDQTVNTHDAVLLTRPNSAKSGEATALDAARTRVTKREPNMSKVAARGDYQNRRRAVPMSSSVRFPLLFILQLPPLWRNFRMSVSLHSTRSPVLSGQDTASTPWQER